MGGKTYVISLPADWVKKHGLKKGQQLEVEEDIGKVVISTNGLKQEKKALEIEYSKDCFEKLVKAYQLGYDEIKLTGAIDIDKLQDTINNAMPGFEIVSTKKEYCMIKCISEIEQKELEPLLRRALLLLSGTGKRSALRLINMCKRCISKCGYRNYSQSLLLYNLLCDMEKAALGLDFKARIAQEIPLRFTEIGFEELEAMKGSAIAASMQELAMARVR